MKNAVILFLLLSLVGCEKNIDFKLDESASTLVVDAEIENGKPPIVVLTKSIAYFSQITPEILANSFVHNAEVFLSNGLLTQKLKEYTNSFIPGFSTYFYSIDTALFNTTFVGAFNTSYQLKVITEGKEYNAETQIPALHVFPDSVYFKPAPDNPDTNTRVLFTIISDLAGLGNYIRYFTKKNTGPFFPGRRSVYTDEVIDGTTYTAKLDPGFDYNNPPVVGEDFFMKSDTITLKVSNINRACYTFWNTWEFAYQSIGNPFAQPNKVIGNISNGALGAFCGYASWTKTIIVP